MAYNKTTANLRAMSTQAVADELGISKGQVAYIEKVALQKARELFKKNLDLSDWSEEYIATQLFQLVGTIENAEVEEFTDTPD